MKVTTLLSVIAFGAASVHASPLSAPESDIAARSDLPGLDATQSTNARGIIAQNKKEGLGKQGCLAGITTAITEASLLILANDAVPKSLDYHHDGLGSDHDSIGLFQQRAEYYPNIKCDMEAGCSAEQFYKGMQAVKGWKTMAIGPLCQAVQKSAYPDAYDKNVALATKICAADGY